MRKIGAIFTRGSLQIIVIVGSRGQAPLNRYNPNGEQVKIAQEQETRLSEIDTAGYKQGNTQDRCTHLGNKPVKTQGRRPIKMKNQSKPRPHK